MLNRINFQNELVFTLYLSNNTFSPFQRASNNCNMVPLDKIINPLWFISPFNHLTDCQYLFITNYSYFFTQFNNIFYTVSL